MKITRFFLLCAFVLLALVAVPAPRAQAAQMLSVATRLNPDGTLDLANGVNGAFDLRGWDVRLDSERGPIFSPAGSGPNVPSAVNDWSALGSNGASDGSLNSYVQALAVIGTDLYVGGAFTDVNNNGTSLTAADYIAKWDGTNGRHSARTARATARSAVPSKPSPSSAPTCMWAGGSPTSTTTGCR